MKTRWISLAVLTATVVAGLAPAASADVRVSPNFRMKSDGAPFRGLDQPGLAVNPNNPQHVVAVYANYLDSECEATVSRDGGSTWSTAVALRPPAGIDFKQWCRNDSGTNQLVEFGTGQNVYTAVSAQKQGAGFLEDTTAMLYKSTDGGQTWQEGTVAMQGGVGGPDPNATQGPSFYRPSISVDRGAGTGGQDRIHIVARDLRSPDNGLCTTLSAPCTPIRAAVSENGGLTFSAPVRVTPAGVNVNDFPSKPIVNADHSVTVAWRVSAVTGPIQVSRRDPQTGQWSAPTDVTIGVNTGTTVPSHVTPGPSGGGSYPRMAGDPARGRLYLVYTQGANGPNAPAGGYQGADHFISPASQVWFQRSSDNGATWSTPKRISEATSFPGARTHQTRHANISVSPNGRVNIVWHDRRHWFQGPGERNCSHSHVFCEDIRLGDTYYSYSTDQGGNFAKPLRITDRSHNNDTGYDTRPSGYWWFAPQVVTVGDDQKALIAWMDSREGNWETDTEDIYLARVDFNGSANPPAPTSLNAADAIGKSVILSQHGYQGGPEGALVNGARDPAKPPEVTCVGTNAPCYSGPASRNASSVVIVNQNDAPSALAGAVLARANPGPVLLSGASGLSAAVKAEVARMHPARAFVIGDATSLSEQVRTDTATAAGISPASVIRISTGSDAANAADIAARMDYRTQAEKDTDVPAFDAAVIANPASPDAAAAAGLAAARRLPFLWVNSDSIPAATQSALSSLDINRTLVIGDTSDVSAGVAGQLPTPKRLGGADQYATSNDVVAESTQRGLPTNVVYVADGAKPVEAALVGAVVARTTGLLVLAPAPLYLTAAGRADSVGASGITRLFAAGPAAPGAPRPPAARTYPGPGGGGGSGSAAFAGCPSLTANVVRGSSANNTLKGTAAGDRIFAGAGDDNVDALAGNDCVDLEAGKDRAKGRAGNDLILGGRGKDRISGDSGKDKVSGGADGDNLSGGGGNDSITGGGGKDKLSGGSGKDKLSGGSGNDRISARDRKRDRVNCGGGKRDVAIVDAIDRVSRNCERVRRSKRR